MNLESRPLHYKSIQDDRENFIRLINSSGNKTEIAKKYSESLFNLGLTMYSRNYSFESTIYDAFATSNIDDNISLHPEQIKALEVFEKNNGTIFSAPTSFGKTFVVFEYIAKYKPKNVVMIVPTLALIDEYKQKIIKKYRNIFSNYNLYLSINEEKEYDFNTDNIFILTHDRVIHEDIVNLFNKIDLLVIDEVYKLQKDISNDRVLILNMAYYNMVKKSGKYILLAPFISGVKNIDKLEYEPHFLNTNFSPVVNEVKTYNIISEDDRAATTLNILRKIPTKENTLIYFPTVIGLNNFINSLLDKQPIELEQNETLSNFITWAKREIHEEWTVTKAISKGYLVHHGQLPLGIRLLQLDLFNNDQYNYSRLLCTSTLLEGVNTTAKHIIITKPCRGHDTGNFDAFDFYNLVGRTGRLFEHYLGIAHYIKSPSDPVYIKDEALKRIEFELTDDSIDIDINCNNYVKHPNFVAFLDVLGITYDEYKENIGAKCRFGTVVNLYDKYREYKIQLLSELHILSRNNEKSKLKLIRILYELMKGKKYQFKLETFLINRLTYLTRDSIKATVDATKEFYPHVDINEIISRAIRLKSSFIEYEFLNKIELVKYFMQCDNIEKYLLETMHNKLIKNIEVIYFLSSPSKRLLKDIGIYEQDINYIVSIIGDDFDTVSDLINLLRINFKRLTQISIVSRYVINNLI